MAGNVERRTSGHADRRVARQGFRNPFEIRRVGREDRDITEKRTIDDPNDRRITERAAVAGHERQVRIERPELGRDAAGGQRQRRLHPRIACAPPHQHDRRAISGPHGELQRRAAQQSSWYVDEFNFRKERAAPRVNGMREGAPTIARPSGDQRADQHGRNNHRDTTQRAAREPALERGREWGLAWRERSGKAFGGTTHKH